jgi:hypothetical protein
VHALALLDPAPWREDSEGKRAQAWQRSPALWLSSWLSRRRNLAGMDGNRTHPGRLNSAPQTVLKTAFLPSAIVRQRPPKIKSQDPASTDVR